MVRVENNVSAKQSCMLNHEGLTMSDYEEDSIRGASHDGQDVGGLAPPFKYWQQARAICQKCLTHVDLFISPGNPPILVLVKHPKVGTFEACEGSLTLEWEHDRRGYRPTKC